VQWEDFVHQRKQLGDDEEDIKLAENIYSFIQNAKHQGVSNSELQVEFDI
jgi:DNA-binding transcriptional regulator YhcF (GntR family)